jgi:hypothetical protein
MPANVTPAPLDANLQLEIDHIDLALALHPDLAAKWLNAAPAADPVTDQGDGAHDNVADAGPAVVSDPEGADSTVSEGTARDANIQFGTLPDALKSLLSGLTPGVDGKPDFSALNAYLAGHAAQTHDLVTIIDQLDANDNHLDNGDGAHSDGTHDTVDGMTDAPPDPFGDEPISLVGVPPVAPT